MANPYETPADVAQASPTVRTYRSIAIMLACFAVVIGYIRVTPFLTSPIATWGWQNWWFGFAPGAYLVFAAVVAVPTEWYANRIALGVLPIVLFPMLLVTGLIVYVLYIDSANIFTVMYIRIGLLCPVVWIYFLLSVHRTWKLLRKSG